MRKEFLAFCVLLVSILVSISAYAGANPDPTNVIVQMVDLLPDAVSSDATADDYNVNIDFAIHRAIPDTAEQPRYFAIWRSSKPWMAPDVFTPAKFRHQKVPWQS